MYTTTNQKPRETSFPFTVLHAYIDSTIAFVFFFLLLSSISRDFRMQIAHSDYALRRMKMCTFTSEDELIIEAYYFLLGAWSMIVVSTRLHRSYRICSFPNQYISICFVCLCYIKSTSFANKAFIDCQYWRTLCSVYMLCVMPHSAQHYQQHLKTQYLELFRIIVIVSLACVNCHLIFLSRIQNLRSIVPAHSDALTVSVQLWQIQNIIAFGCT